MGPRLRSAPGPPTKKRLAGGFRRGGRRWGNNRGRRQAASKRWKNDRYRWRATRRSSVETSSPRSHCCSRSDRSRAKPSASPLHDLGHQLVRRLHRRPGLIDEGSLNLLPSLLESLPHLVRKQRLHGLFTDERCFLDRDPLAGPVRGLRLFGSGPVIFSLFNGLVIGPRPGGSRT